MLAEAYASGTPVPSSFAAERSAKLYRLLGAMNGVAVSREPTGDVGDVSLRPAASGQDAFVAQRDVHGPHPRCDRTDFLRRACR